jgi:hypothetical protein
MKLSDFLVIFGYNTRVVAEIKGSGEGTVSFLLFGVN